MYDKLVKRLRNAAHLAEKGLVVISPNMCLEAADALEKLSISLIEIISIAYPEIILDVVSKEGGRDMSVNRETIAKVLDIPPEQVKCANCARHSAFINGLLWCDGWGASARADGFCSFYEKESEEENG